MYSIHFIISASVFRSYNTFRNFQDCRYHTLNLFLISHPTFDLVQMVTWPWLTLDFRSDFSMARRFGRITELLDSVPRSRSIMSQWRKPLMFGLLEPPSTHCKLWHMADVFSFILHPDAPLTLMFELLLTDWQGRLPSLDPLNRKSYRAPFSTGGRKWRGCLKMPKISCPRSSSGTPSKTAHNRSYMYKWIFMRIPHSRFFTNRVYYYKMLIVNYICYSPNLQFLY